MYLELAFLKRGFTDTQGLSEEERAVRSRVIFKVVENLQEYFNPVYQHVEMRFKDAKTGATVATGATESRPLFWYSNKTYSRENWTVLQLVNMPEYKVQRVHDFCRQAYLESEARRKAGEEGNIARRVDQIRAITPFPRHDGNYFCSEYVMCALQAAGYFPYMSANSTVPYDIYVLVKEKFSTVNVFRASIEQQKRALASRTAPDTALSQYAALEKLYDTV